MGEVHTGDARRRVISVVQEHCFSANSPDRSESGHLVALCGRNADAVERNCEGQANFCYHASRRGWAARMAGVVIAATKAGREMAMVRCPVGLEVEDATQVEVAGVAAAAVAKTFAGAHRSDGVAA